jgi:hypothetical protein
MIDSGLGIVSVCIVIRGKMCWSAFIFTEWKFAPFLYTPPTWEKEVHLLDILAAQTLKMTATPFFGFTSDKTFGVCLLVYSCVLGVYQG